MNRIAICAPSTPISLDIAGHVRAVAASFPGLELVFHDQCFASYGHFAGDDVTRLRAFVDCANDPAFDAVWFAKGGYGANRIAAEAVSQLGAAARGKAYLGYSDAGYLLAALYRAGIGTPVHAPMPVDLRREGGEGAIRRTLGWMTGDASGLESGLDDRPAAAFNLMTLAMLAGTDLMPDLAGHVVLVEEVAEHLYSIDRLFFHISQHLHGIAGLRLGRIGDVPENDRPFGANPAQIAQYWCDRAGIPFVGTADIGHDADNRIVPFGLAGSRLRP